MPQDGDGLGANPIANAYAATRRCGRLVLAEDDALKLRLLENKNRYRFGDGLGNERRLGGEWFRVSASRNKPHASKMGVRLQALFFAIFYLPGRAVACDLSGGMAHAQSDFMSCDARLM